MTGIVELVKVCSLAALAGLVASAWVSDVRATGIGVACLYLLTVRISGR